MYQIRSCYTWLKTNPTKDNDKVNCELEKDSRKLGVFFTVCVFSASAHLKGEHKVTADALLCDDVLHGAKRGAQIGVEKLSGQETHRGGHQVVWQRHVCDLNMEIRKFQKAIFKELHKAYMTCFTVFINTNRAYHYDHLPNIMLVWGSGDYWRPKP